MTDLLVVGLGNPGEEYSETRHNLGYRVVDLLAARWKKEFYPGKGEYLCTGARIGASAVTLVKPTTFMNLSGRAVEEAAGCFLVSPEQLLVVLDDMALPLGSLRIRLSGSDGGHNGLASVIWSLQTDRFTRLRCGIGGETAVPAEQFAAYVLAPFRSEEIDVVQEMVGRAADAVESIALRGAAQTMNRYNT